MSDAVADVIAETTALARRVRREDLVERLTSEARRVGETEVSVVVAGASGAGKTALVNALVAQPALPEGEATEAPVLLRGGTSNGIVHFADAPRLECLSADELRPWITASDSAERRAVAVEAWAATEALPAGLVVVDTPGFEAAERSDHHALVSAVAWRTDGVLFVTSAAAPLSAEELSFLQSLERKVAHIWVAVTRTDRFRGWREIVTDDAEMLRAELGSPVEAVVGVSSRLRMAAGESAIEDFDAVLAEESGVPGLRNLVFDTLLDRRAEIRVANLLRHCEAALDEVETSLRRVQVSIAEGEDAAVRRLRTEIDRVRLTGDEAQLLVRDGFATLRESASAELSRLIRVHTVKAREAKAADALDALVAELPDALVAVADEFERRSARVVDAAESLRVGSTAEQVANGEMAWGGGVNGGTDADDASGVDEPLRIRAARSAVSGGMGMALAAQRVLGGGDIVAGLLAVGTLVGAATGVLAIRAAKRNQDLAAARRAAIAAMDDARVEAMSALRQRALVRQRESEAALKQQIRLHTSRLQNELEEAVRAARFDAATRQRASAAAAKELERATSLQERVRGLAAELHGR